MDRHTIIVTTDKRQEALANLLEGEKKIWEEHLRNEEEAEKIYVLPIPVAKIDRNQTVKEKLKKELADMSQRPYVHVKVFGGVFDNEWISFFETHQIPYWDFMKLSEVVEGNAKITAEATVAEVLQMGNYSIEKQKILVTGYGCCGKKIAEIFSRLGAEVVVAVRRESVQKEIQKDGFFAIDFSKMERYAEDISTIINTVPAMVVKESCIKKMKSDGCVIDIASKPGGTDFEAAKKYGIQSKLALGLPALYTTTSSAKLLKDAISKYAPLQNQIREGKSWIFQVII